MSESRLLTVAALLLLTTASPAMAEQAQTLDDVEQQILATSQQLQALDAEITESQALKAKLKKAVKAAESRVGERQQRIQGLDEDIARYTAKLKQLDGQLQAAEATVATRKATLAESMRRSQRLGNDSSLKVLLQHDDPALADRLGVYTGYFLQAQNKTMAEELAALAKISEARAIADKDRNWLNHIKRKASAQYADYHAQQQSQQSSLQQVEQQLTEKNRSVATLKADQQRLQTLMDELKALQLAQSGYFEASQGRLPMPVKGRVEARFGDVKSVGHLTWNGLFLSAPVGRPVLAVADGEVVYSDWLQGFGMLVILDHGDGYMTLYGGNRDVIVEVGAWTESGATIATVGDSGGQTLSGVYFEIRHNAKPVDPELWLGSGNNAVAGTPDPTGGISANTSTNSRTGS